MFDRYLEAQAHPAGRHAKRILVIVSMAVHAVAVVALIVWSFVHVEEVQPPLLTVTFFKGGAPPPPPPPPPPARKSSKTPTKPKTPMVQPKDVQPLIQPKEPEEQEVEEDEGVEGGVEGGVPGGVPGGVLGGVPGGVLPDKPAAPPPEPKPIVKPHAPDPSEWISQPDPHVPDAIKIQRKGTEGVFFAKVCVNMRGEVTTIDVKQGIPGADDAIIATLRQWRLRPQSIPICFPVRLVYTFE